MRRSSTKQDFFKGNHCVIQVYNPTDKTCFCCCMVLGLSKLEKIPGQLFKKMRKNCQTDLNRALSEVARDA